MSAMQLALAIGCWCLPQPMKIGMHCLVDLRGGDPTPCLSSGTVLTTATACQHSWASSQVAILRYLAVCLPQVTPMTDCTHANGFVDMHQILIRCRCSLSARTPPCETGQTVIFVLQASAAPHRRCTAFGQAYRCLSRCCGMLHSKTAAAATWAQQPTSRAPTSALASWHMCSLRMSLALRPPPPQVLVCHCTWQCCCCCLAC